MDVRAALCTALVVGSALALTVLNTQGLSDAVAPDHESPGRPEPSSREPAADNQRPAPASQDGPALSAPVNGLDVAAPDGTARVTQAAAGSLAVSMDGAERIGTIQGIAADAQVQIVWSPSSDWFYLNERRDSGAERVRVFQIVGELLVERSAVLGEAVELMLARHSCLRAGGASARAWSRDGRRIALIASGSCGDRGPGVEPLWMVGDVDSGRIDPASVRQRGNWPMPREGAYADF